MSASSGWLSKAAFALLVCVVTFAILTARAVSRGEDLIARSDAAFDRGDLDDAITFARRAAASYAPGAPHVTQAYERLRAIAVGAESTGRPAVARSAWEATRDAALQSRHLWVPRRQDLERANENLARLLSPDGRPSSRERVSRALEQDMAPSGPWIVLLGAGFALVALGLVGVGVRASVEGPVPWGRLGWPGLVFLVGVACWTIAVYKA